MTTRIAHLVPGAQIRRCMRTNTTTATKSTSEPTHQSQLIRRCMSTNNKPTSPPRSTSPSRVRASLKSHSSRIRSRPSSTTSASLPEGFANHAHVASAVSTAGQPRSKAGRNILPLELVESSSVKLALPVIGNVSYMALASGFLMTDMLTLRIALVGGYTGLVAFHLLHARPLRIPLKWSAFFIAVNAGAACFLIADQWPGSLSEEDEMLYNEHFPMLTPGQFKQLLKLGTTRTFPDGSRLTVEGVHSDIIYFTKKGHSKLYLRDKYAKDIDEGSFVNDVAFQQGDGMGAYGTVITEGEVEVIEWNWQQLREHLESQSDMDRNMRLCFTSHLVKGLLQQRKAAYNSQGSNLMEMIDSSEVTP